MSEHNTPTSDSRDERIGRILNDFHDRRARGETVTVEGLLAAHPDLVADLKPYLEMLGDFRSEGDRIQRLIDDGVLRESDDAAYQATLGDYKTVGFIGRGGMGIVLKAYEARLGRTVALKILRPELADDKASLQRFTREAKAAGMLRHPNIVTVYAVGEQHGIHYIAMEYIEGSTLADMIHEQGPLPTETIRTFFGEVLLGLAAAHESGVVHRDIKSANILLDGPRQSAKIADFGLALMAASQTRITLPDASPGTPEYMSPEQARGDEDIDLRADLYSAGVVLYEMLTGRTPFRSDTPSVVIHRILLEDPVDPRTLNDNADPHLASLAMRLMAKQPEDRFASTREAIEALAQREYVRSPEARRHKRQQIKKIAAVVVLVASGVFAISRALWLENATERSRSIPASINSVSVEKDNPHLKTVVLATYGDDPLPRTFHNFRSRVEQVECAVLANLEGLDTPVVVVGTKGAKDGRNLIVFDLNANEIQHLDLSSDRYWPDCAPPTHWYCHALAASNLDGEDGDEIIVAASDFFEYPARISIIDPRTWTVQSTFWHIGQMTNIRVLPDYFADGAPAILALANNNKLDGFENPLPGDAKPLTCFNWVQVLMILDPRNMSGLGPPLTDQIDIAPTTPYCYAFLDLATCPTMKKTLGESGKTGTPTRLELGCIEHIRDAQHQKTDQTAPWFRLDIMTSCEPSEKSGLAILNVDRHLGFRSVMITAEEDEGRTEEYWKARWRPVIQRGEYVEQ